jgi:hypothetical protein
MADAVPLPGASLATYRVLEQRAAAQADGWDVVLTPPQMATPTIAFTGSADTLDAPAREAVLVSAWAARRWNVRSLGVPGLPPASSEQAPEEAPEKPTLVQRRALAVAALLRENGIAPLPAPAAGSRFALRRIDEGETQP